MLDAAGLSPLEEAVYRELVAVPSASVAGLRRALGCGEAALRRSLARLEALGLVSRTAGQRSRFVAAPPDVAIEPLVLAQQLRLERARAEAASLMEGYRAARHDRGAGELVEVVIGTDAIMQRFEQVQRAARHQVCALVTPPFLADNEDDHYRAIELQQLARGVRYRTVYDQDGFAAQGGIDAMLADAAAGEEVRLARRLPIKLFLVDDTVAFVPMTGTGDVRPGAVLVHPSGLLTGLAALFELVWERAAPFAPTPPRDCAPDPLGEDGRRLLAMLGAGLTDAAMARQLGTSLRTVQRRIRELMDLAGATTRFQLGQRAERLGWTGEGRTAHPVERGPDPVRDDRLAERPRLAATAARPEG
ncbi:MAG TPA: helix-turn-helix domain-containing protein [Natronosporangium sp.]|nr:helix-turn-helix domain-containing protein [Natronosporangium sp.]